MTYKKPSLPTIVKATALSGLLVFAAGCGGGADRDASSPTTTVVDPLLGSLLGGKSMEEAQMEMEKIVQKCMTDLGWEYTIVASGSQGDMTVIGDDDADEFAQQNGYGIMSSYAAGSELAPGAVAVAAPGGGANTDPNAKYVQSLSESDQAAYYEDLYGASMSAPQEVSEDGAVPAGSMEIGGCYGQANEEVFGENNTQKLDEKFREVDERMASDSRILDAEKAWAQCMSDAGYDFDTQMDAVTSIMDKLQSLGDEPSEQDIASLRDEEIKTAVADRECSNEVKLDEIRADVYQDIATQVARES